MSGYRSLGTSPSRLRSDDSHRALFKSFNNPNYLSNNQRNFRSITSPYSFAFENGYNPHKFLSLERQTTDQTNFQSTNKQRDQYQQKQIPIFERSNKRNYLTSETNGSNFISRYGNFYSVASAGQGDLISATASEVDKSYSNPLLHNNELAKKKIEYFTSSAKNLILSSLKLKKLIQNNPQFSNQYELNLFNIDYENMEKAIKHLGISSKDSDIGFQKLMDELKEENNSLKMRIISEPFKSARENVELSQRFEQERESLQIKYEKLEKQFQKIDKKYQEKKTVVERLYSILEEKEKELSIFQQDFEIVNIQLQNKVQDIYVKDEQLALLQREIDNIQNHNPELLNYPYQSQYNVQELMMRLQNTEQHYQSIIPKLESELIIYQEENEQIKRQWMEVKDQIDFQHINIQNQSEKVMLENQDLWEKRLEQCAKEWQIEVEKRDTLIQQKQRELESQIREVLINERKSFEQQQKIQILEQQKEIREDEFDNILEQQKRKIQALNEEIEKQNMTIKQIQISKQDDEKINKQACQQSEQNSIEQLNKEQPEAQRQTLKDHKEEITILKRDKVLLSERICSLETKISETKMELQQVQEELIQAQQIKFNVQLNKENDLYSNHQQIDLIHKQLYESENKLKVKESQYLAACIEVNEARETNKTIQQELLKSDIKIQEQSDENKQYQENICSLQSQLEQLKYQLEEQLSIRQNLEDQQKLRVQEILSDIKLNNNFFSNLQEELKGAKFSWESAQKAIQILGERLLEKDSVQNVINQQSLGEINAEQNKVQELIKIQQKLETDITQACLINDNMRKEIITGEKQIHSIEQMNTELQKQIEDQQLKQLQICDQQQILSQNHIKCMELKQKLQNNSEVEQKQNLEIETQNEKQSQYFESLQRDYNLLHQQYQDSKESLKYLEYEYEQTKIQYDNKLIQTQSLCEKLNERISLLSKENEELKSNIIEKDDNLAKLKNNLQDHEKERVHQVNLHEQKVDTLNNQINLIQQELNSSNQKLDHSNEKYQLQQQLHQQQTEGYQQEIQDKLQSLLKENQELVDSKNKISLELENISKQYDTQSQNLNILQAELKINQQEQCIKYEQIKDLIEKCTQFEEKEKNQCEEVNKLQLKINILHNDKEKILLELQSTKASESTQGIERNLVIEQMQSEQKNLNIKYELESTQNSRQILQLQQEFDIIKKEYQENYDKLKKYEKENSQIAERNNQLLEKLNEYKEEQNNLLFQQNQLQITYEQLNLEKDQISKLLEQLQKNHDIMLISNQQQINEKDNVLQNTIQLQEQKEQLIQDLINKNSQKDFEIQYLKQNLDDKNQENIELNKKLQYLNEQTNYLQELQTQDNYKNILPNQSLQTSKQNQQKLIIMESPSNKLDENNSQNIAGQQDDTQQVYQLNSSQPKTENINQLSQNIQTSKKQSNEIQSPKDNNNQFNEEYIIEEFDYQSNPQNILKKEKNKKSSMPFKSEVLYDDIDSQKEINQLQTQINELNQLSNDLNKQIDELRKQNNELSNQNIDLSKQTFDLKSQYSDISLVNIDLKQQIENLINQQIDNSNENTNLKNQINILNKQVIDFNLQIDELNKQIENFKLQNNQLKEQNAQLNNLNQEIQGNEKKLKEQITQYEKNEADSENISKVKIEQLQNQLNEFSKFNPLQAELSHLQEQLNQANDELKEQNQRILSQQQEITLGENQMDQQQQTILFLQDKIESQSEYLKHVEEELKQQKIFSVQLENNLEKKRKQLEDSDNLQLDTEQRLKAELQLKQEYIQKLESTHKNKAELTLAQSQQTIAELQNEVNRQKVKLDQYKQDHNIIDGLKREIRELQRQIRDANIERERLEMDRQQFEDDMNLQRLSQQDYQFKLEVLEMKTKNYFGMLLKTLLIFDVDLDEQVSPQTHSLEDLLSLGLQLSKQYKSNNKNLQILQKSPIEGTTAASLFTLQSPHITSQSENPNLIKSYSQCLEGLINNILSNPTNLRNSLQIDLLQHPYQQMFLALLNQVEIQFQQFNTLLTNQQPSSIREIEENFDDFQKQLQIQQQKQQIKAQQKAISPNSRQNDLLSIQPGQQQARNSGLQQQIFNGVPSFVRDDDSFLEDLNSNNENKANVNNFEPFNPFTTTSPSNKNHPTFENQTNQIQTLKQELNMLKVKFTEEKDVIVNKYESEVTQLKKQIKELREMTKDVELIKNQKQTLKAITENFLGLLSDKKKQKTQEAKHFFNILCSMLDIQTNIKDDLEKGLFNTKK